MQLILNILIVFIIINTLIKLSFWKLWQVAIMGVLSAGFLLFAYTYAIEQSQVTIQQALENTKVLSNMAVLVSIEAGFCIGFCFLALRTLFFGKESRGYKILKWYPSLLIFPVLFYLLTQSIFYFSGADFFTTTTVLAIGVLLLIIGGAYGIKELLPEEDFRLEVHFLTSLFITILGLISTTNGNTIYVPKSEPMNFTALGLTFLLFIGMFILGFFINKIWWRIRKTK